MHPKPERASLSTSVPKPEMPCLETASISLFDADENAVIPATILAVDSEEINRRLLKAIFKTTPYKILEARQASEATALLETEKIGSIRSGTNP